MGLFGNFKFKRKSDAYGILQKHFARYAPLHGINIDPKRDAYELVENACHASPDLLGTKLHRVTLSAAVVTYGMDNCFENGALDEARFFLHCLGQILIDIESDFHRFGLSENDIRVINNCSDIYKEFAQRLDDGTDLRQ